MSKKSLVRTIYIYLFAGVGLVLLTIGVVRFIDMGLKAFVFTEAAKEERLEINQYRNVPRVTVSNLDRYEGEVTEEELESLRRMIEDYETQEEKWEEVDRYKAKKQEEASYNLAFILVGLPLFGYHWHLVRKEN